MCSKKKTDDSRKAELRYERELWTRKMNKWYKSQTNIHNVNNNKKHKFKIYLIKELWKKKKSKQKMSHENLFYSEFKTIFKTPSTAYSTTQRNLLWMELWHKFKSNINILKEFRFPGYFSASVPSTVNTEVCAHI